MFDSIGINLRVSRPAAGGDAGRAEPHERGEPAAARDVDPGQQQLPCAADASRRANAAKDPDASGPAATTSDSGGTILTTLNLARDH